MYPSRFPNSEDFHFPPFTKPNTPKPKPPGQAPFARRPAPGERRGPGGRARREDPARRRPPRSEAALQVKGRPLGARRGRGPGGRAARRRGWGGPRTPPVGLPARVAAGSAAPAAPGHLRGTAQRGLAGSGRTPPALPGPAGRCPPPAAAGRRVSEGLRRLAPSPRLPRPWKVPEMTFEPDN